MIKDRETLEVWITKYALSQGIYQAVVENCGQAMVRQGYMAAFHGDEWHTDRDAAVAKARDMQTKKIAALRKQLEKLERMEFF